MADYEYYVNCYLGTEIPEKAFSRLAKRAGAYLDKMKRTWLVEGGADATAMAICAMAETLQRADKCKGIAGASLGGVSVQYEPLTKAQLMRELYDQAAIYLDIFRGRCCYESH